MRRSAPCRRSTRWATATPVPAWYSTWSTTPTVHSCRRTSTKLEADYKRMLAADFGIVFNHLFALANMPIKRFGSWLLSKGQFRAYMGTLRAAHQRQEPAIA